MRLGDGHEVRAILFDFDGTLADRYATITASVNHVRATHGLSLLEQSEVRRLGVGAGLGLGSPVHLHAAEERRAPAAWVVVIRGRETDAWHWPTAGRSKVADEGRFFDVGQALIVEDGRNGVTAGDAARFAHSSLLVDRLSRRREDESHCRPR